jgi:hypothetical protein
MNIGWHSSSFSEKALRSKIPTALADKKRYNDFAGSFRLEYGVLAPVGPLFDHTMQLSGCRSGFIAQRKSVQYHSVLPRLHFPTFTLPSCRLHLQVAAVVMHHFFPFAFVHAPM